MDNRKIWAVLPAAGRGQRFSKTELKQYQTLLDKTVLQHSVNALTKLPLAGCVIAIHLDDHIATSLDFAMPVQFCQGGAERMDSVLAALQHLQSQAQPDDYVLVHDAARPCLHNDTLQAILDFCQSGQDAAIVAIPVRDTLKLAKNLSKENNGLHYIDKTISREQMWQAQTPQIVKYQLLVDALQSAKQQQAIITDEASSLELLGVDVGLISGRNDNIKITYPEDLPLAELILKSWIKD
ncbi:MULTISPECIES: 2-C-methyl-D-erythritol 4-phosphate cytidylyltransferase [unclassified Acinetobacter]|uniref:2-C-methyl-D-erythritol 4-phosphate cytidylyltransferase n=1 Tax=unclassified Acinetobacter TaxID=196816 RepID=UPI0035BAD9B3